MPVNPFDRELRKVADPLSEEARRSRKALLIWCLVAAAITLGGLFPSEITTLGLKVTTNDRVALLALIAIVVGYFLLTFLVYGASDFMGWYLRYRSTEWEEDVANYEEYKKELLARTKLSQEDREFMEEHERRLGAIWRAEAVDRYQRLAKAVPFLSAFRAAVEFLLPILAAVSAMYLLLLHK